MCRLAPGGSASGRASLWLERDGAAPGLFCRCGHLLLLTLLLCLRLDLSHPKAVKGVADDHLARLAALHNVVDLPADNLAAGEEVQEAVVEVIVGGVVEGNGPLADAVRPAVRDGGQDGGVGQQLGAQRQGVVAITGVTRAGLGACMDDMPGGSLGDRVLDGVLGLCHVHGVMLVQQFWAGDALEDRSHFDEGTIKAESVWWA